MPEDIGLLDALYSQRAIRYFKPDPVSDELVHRLIEAASKAPSGGNSQGWKFLVIRDQKTKDRIGEYYERGWEAAYGKDNPSPPSIQSHVRRSADYLARHMAESPVLIMACIEHDGSPSTMGRGGSIFPAVQNLLLAARALGTRQLPHQPAQAALRTRSKNCSIYQKTLRPQRCCPSASPPTMPGTDPLDALRSKKSRIAKSGIRRGN